MDININKESLRFYEFIQEQHNDNIIFSGIFGIGKSFFLSKFFNERYKDEYVSIYLTPVNYSIASNEDIFEYIKVDILLQLLEKVPCDFSKTEISKSVATYFYLKNNIDIFITKLLTAAEKVKFGTDILGELLKLKAGIESFQKENSIDNEQSVKSFIEKMSQNIGSIYESNAITQIIQTLVENIHSSSNNERKVVLVVDDLDRIDPEHIFRILNIFSAHNDFCKTGEHKFKIDKTILVCDIDNVRKIFHARYGADVDFTGYIDKFYSKEIFYFQNENNIIEAIAEQITVNSTFYSDEFLKNGIGNKIIRFILAALIKSKAINIRTLLRFDTDFSLNKYVYANGRRFETGNILSISIFEIIERLFTNKNDVKIAINSLSHYEADINSVDFDPYFFLSIFIAMADFENNRFVPGIDPLSYNEIGYTPYVVNQEGLVTISQTADIDKINIYSIIADAYNNYYTYFSKIK